MQRRAYESDIIIVNHHLFFADLAVKEEEFGGVLPEYNAVIFDEAHEIEDIAGAYFGVSISSYQIAEYVRDVRAVTARKNAGSPELDRALLNLNDAAELFFQLFPLSEGRTGFGEHATFLRKHSREYEEVLHALELVWTHLELIQNAPEEIIP